MIKEETMNIRKRFLISKGNRYIKINSADIAFFILENRIVYAYTFNLNRYVINNTLEKIENELDANYYFRVNRQIIINIEAFDYFENYFNGKLVLRLKNNLYKSIVISRTKAVIFKNWLDS